MLKLIMVLVLLSGCAEIRIKKEKETFNTIKLSDSKISALQKLGQPEERVPYLNGEILFWEAVYLVTDKDKVVGGNIIKNRKVFAIDLENIKDQEPANKKVWITSQVKGIETDSLDFKFTKNAVGILLQKQGYILAKSEKEPDISAVIFVNFGISDPIVTTKTWTEPVYDYVMPNTNNNTSTTKVYNQYGANIGSFETTTGNPYAINLPQEVYRGERTRTSKETKYLRYIILEAVDYQHFIKTKHIKAFWKIKALSEGSLGDYNKVLPYLLLGMDFYFKQDIKENIGIEMEDNRSLDFIPDYMKKSELD